MSLLVPDRAESPGSMMLGDGRAPRSADPGRRLRDPMPADRRRSWLVTLALTVVAGLVRMWDLGSPTDNGTPVFDEKHYVPQAWQMLTTSGVENNPGYELVVHPPVGKQLMAVGEYLFGYTPWGWRFSAAIAGALCVLLIVRAGRRLTRSTMLGAIAGILLICDGVSHVASRTGMLDIFLVLFVVGAFAALLADRDQVRERLATAVAQGWAQQSRLGPQLGYRWWRLLAGASLGMACGVKWSGVYFVAAFGVLSVFWDWMARRQAGVARPLLGTISRDLLPALWALALLPVLVYTATWWAWFASETGTDRHAVQTASQVPGMLGVMPDVLRSLYFYSANVLDFHTHLLTPKKDPHPWESKPWSWPMGLRPVLYYQETGSAAAGCGRSECVRSMMMLGTPAMWWLAFPMLGWSLWRVLRRADWRYGAVLLAYCAGWLPWFVNIERQMYYFYAVVMAPFLVLGIVLVLGQLLGRADAPRERRLTGRWVVAIYVGLVIANFLWLWPMLTGDSISLWRWNAELWLPSWR